MCVLGLDHGRRLEAGHFLQNIGKCSLVVAHILLYYDLILSEERNRPRKLILLL